MFSKIARRTVLAAAVLALAAIMFGCGGSGSAKKASAQKKPAVAYKDGTYEGSSSMGMHGEMKLGITISGGRIAEVKILSKSETEGIGSVAAQNMTVAMVEQQTGEVDAVSGATVTSKAVLEAAASALAQAR